MKLREENEQLKQKLQDAEIEKQALRNAANSYKQRCLELEAEVEILFKEANRYKALYKIEKWAEK